MVERGTGMQNDFFELAESKRQKQELTAVLACNDKTERFGLVIAEEEAKELVLSRNVSLKKYQRVEFGKGILDSLIFAFCDSEYVNQENYAGILTELQDIFYRYKNESEDKLTDEELLTFMRETFDTVCAGDLEYLAGTCLERFCRAVRAGYDGYRGTGGSGVYEIFDEEPRWDKGLYLCVLRELAWE